MRSPNWCPECEKEAEWLVIPSKPSFVQCKECGHIKKIPKAIDENVATETSETEIIGKETSRKKKERLVVENIGWGRSFALALKSTIVGFLLGFVWIVVHTIIRYSLLMYSLRIYNGYWFTPDFGQILLADSMSLFFPFMPFQPGGSSGSPIFGLFSVIFGQYFSTYEILFFILNILFLFLVYISQLVPTIKYSSEEAGHSISWKRGYIVGIKAGIVGLILAIVFVSIAFSFMLAAFSSGGSALTQSEYSPGMILGGIIVIVLIFVVLLFFAEAATGASVVKFTTSEVKRGGIGWQRSFWVAIKASVVGLLWAILFAIIFGIFLGIVLIAVIGSFSASAVVAGGSLVIAMLFITLVLVALAPTASIIKYLVEELLNMPEYIEEKGERGIENTNISEHVASQVLDDKLLPSSTIKAEFSGKKECGNCALFLTANCPRNYPDDGDVWKSQKVCELFYPRNA